MKNVIAYENSILTPASASAPASAPTLLPKLKSVLDALKLITGADKAKAQELETIINHIVEINSGGNLETACFLDKFAKGYEKHNDYVNMPALDETTYNDIFNEIKENNDGNFNTKVNAYKDALTAYVTANKTDIVDMLTTNSLQIISFNNDNFKILSDNLFPNKSSLTSNIINQVTQSKNITELSNIRNTITGIFNSADDTTILNVLYNYIEFEKAYVARLGVLLQEDTVRIGLYEKEYIALGDKTQFDVNIFAVAATPPELQSVIDLFKKYKEVKNNIDIELGKIFKSSDSVDINIRVYDSIKDDTVLNAEIQKVSNVKKLSEYIHPITKFDGKKAKLIKLLETNISTLNTDKTLFENQLKQKMITEINKIASDVATSKTKYDAMKDTNDDQGNVTKVGNKNTIVDGVNLQKGQFAQIIVDLTKLIVTSYDRVKTTCKSIDARINDYNLNTKIILGNNDIVDSFGKRHNGLYELGDLIDTIRAHISTTFDTSKDVYDNYGNGINNLIESRFFINISNGNIINNDSKQNIKHLLKSTQDQQNQSNSIMYDVIDKLKNKGDTDDGLWKILLDAMTDLCNLNLQQCYDKLSNMITGSKITTYNNAIKHIMNFVLELQIFYAFGQYTRHIGQMIKTSLTNSSVDYDATDNTVDYNKFLDTDNVTKINDAFKQIIDIRTFIDKLVDIKKDDGNIIVIKTSDYYKIFKNLDDETNILKSLVETIQDFNDKKTTLDTDVPELDNIIFNESYPIIDTSEAINKDATYIKLKTEYKDAERDKASTVPMYAKVIKFITKQSEIKDTMTTTVKNAITLFSDKKDGKIIGILESFKEGFAGGKKKVYNRKNNKYGSFVVQKGGYLQEDFNLLLDIQGVLLRNYTTILTEEVNIYPVVKIYNNNYQISKIDDSIYSFYTKNNQQLYDDKLKNSYNDITDIYKQFLKLDDDSLKQQIEEKIVLMKQYIDLNVQLVADETQLIQEIQDIKDTINGLNIDNPILDVDKQIANIQKYQTEFNDINDSTNKQECIKLITNFETYKTEYTSFSQIKTDSDAITNIKQIKKKDIPSDIYDKFTDNDIKKDIIVDTNLHDLIKKIDAFNTELNTGNNDDQQIINIHNANKKKLGILDTDCGTKKNLVDTLVIELNKDDAVVTALYMNVMKQLKIDLKAGVDGMTGVMAQLKSIVSLDQAIVQAAQAAQAAQVALDSAQAIYSKSGATLQEITKETIALKAAIGVAQHAKDDADAAAAAAAAAAVAAAAKPPPNQPPPPIPDEPYIYDLVNIAYSMCMANIADFKDGDKLDNHPMVKDSNIGMKYELSDGLKALLYPADPAAHVAPDSYIKPLIKKIDGKDLPPYDLSKVLFLPNTNSDENFKFNYALKLGEYIINKVIHEKAAGAAGAAGAGSPVPAPAPALPVIDNVAFNKDIYNKHNVEIHNYDSSVLPYFTKDTNKSTTYDPPKKYTINILQYGDSYHLLPIDCDDSIAGGGKSKSKSKSKKVSYKKLYHKNKKMLEKLKNI